MIFLSDSLYYRSSSFAGYTESHATALYVGARDVELDAGNAGQFVDACSTFGIVLGRIARYVYKYIAVNVFQLGVNMFAKVVDSLVLQSDAVEHTRGCFGHARVVVSFARVQGCAFYNETAQTVEVYEVGKFQTVAKCAGGRHDGVFKCKVADVYI